MHKLITLATLLLLPFAVNADSFGLPLGVTSDLLHQDINNYKKVYHQVNETQEDASWFIPKNIHTNKDLELIIVYEGNWNNNNVVQTVVVIKNDKIIAGELLFENTTLDSILERFNQDSSIKVTIQRDKLLYPYPVVSEAAFTKNNYNYIVKELIINNEVLTLVQISIK